MELWVRSQDKEKLDKVNQIICRESRDENNKIHYEIQNLYTLGTYETKERALGVLDEIQSLLMFDGYYDYTGKAVVKNNIAIYLMPKE